ncbi:ribonuclease PH [Gudongella sp. DL1XJH-153]|uniref:ribonuclease PH n=1 Tax=Gudongella sp. DL1XJH-153 TaxID=3409804 RepID=UPI003BB7F92D
MRIDNRKSDEMRSVKIERDYLLHPYGSVLIQMGDTKVICTAMVEDKVPHFLKNTGTGWVTAEYSMLPGSTITRKMRDSTKGRIDGRNTEIQRLIGRSLRSVVDLKKLGEKTVWIDCDVIQADGGTRTASITGAYIALVDALHKSYKQGELKEFPITGYLSAISVGVGAEGPILDLCYQEDHIAMVDMNVVMGDGGKYVEVQGTGENSTFSRKELDQLLDLAEKGTSELIELQKEILGPITDLI